MSQSSFSQSCQLATAKNTLTWSQAKAGKAGEEVFETYCDTAGSVGWGATQSVWTANHSNVEAAFGQLLSYILKQLSSLVQR